MAALSLFVVLGVFALASAQFDCKGFVSSPKVITSDVTVIGSNCVLSGVNITGNVRVTQGGSLTTQGITNINGCLHGFQAGDMNLQGTLKVGGGLAVLESQATVTVGPKASVGTVSVTMIKHFVSTGEMTSLSVAESNNVHIFGGKITGGGVFRRGGNGQTLLCGVNIFGGISLGMVTGDLMSVKGPSCGPITLKGAISVMKGKGQVQFSGGSFEGTDMLVEQQAGNVVIDNVAFSDVLITGHTGAVSLKNIKLDSDTSINGVSGTVTLDNIMTDGDLKLENSGAVNIINNNFGLEVVSVTGNSGPVKVTGNKDFSIMLAENKDVTFNNNNVRVASITKNTGITSINNNKVFDGGALSCADNSPAPVGFGNTVPLAATAGQCANIVTVVPVAANLS